MNISPYVQDIERQYVNSSFREYLKTLFPKGWWKETKVTTLGIILFFIFGF